MAPSGTHEKEQPIQFSLYIGHVATWSELVTFPAPPDLALLKPLFICFRNQLPHRLASLAMEQAAQAMVQPVQVAEAPPPAEGPDQPADQPAQAAAQAVQAPQNVCIPHRPHHIDLPIPRFLRTIPARQRVNPITLQRQAAPRFPWNLPIPHFGQIFTVMRLHDSSYCRYQADPQSTPFQDPIFDVHIETLTHDHVDTEWFRYLATGLAKTRLKVNLDSPEHTWLRRHMIHPRGVHAMLNLSALTATALQMRFNVDGNPQNPGNQQAQEAFVRIVSLNPRVVARDFRLYGMGEVVGINAIQYLLAAIFQKLREEQYTTSEVDLIYAAADLLVTHLAQDNRHRLIRRGPMESVYSILLALIQIDDLDELEEYARMAAIRDGIIFGAMRAYAKDIDSHNESHVAVLNDTGTGLSDVANTAAGAAGPLAVPVVRTVFTSIKLPFKNAIKNRWALGALDTEIIGDFRMQIRAYANCGRIKGWPDVIAATSDTAQRYANIAEDVMNGIATQVSPLTRGVYW
ncbi:hypothetical protein FRC02_002974 [Tulasnella sp. 418]|nr:hypothetical protein FRC02_002974 [Tulasnella sp. 418]